MVQNEIAVAMPLEAHVEQPQARSMDLQSSTTPTSIPMSNLKSSQQQEGQQLEEHDANRLKGGCGCAEDLIRCVLCCFIWEAICDCLC